MYQCAEWKSSAFQDLLCNAGSIMAGAAFITKVIESFTTSRWLPHYAFVTTATKPKDLKKLVQLTLLPKPRWIRNNMHMKRTFAILVITIIRSILQYVTPRIDRDGFHTLDYFVTLVFCYALVFALVLRNWNPYHFTRMVYTEHLWLKGRDTFVSIKEGESHEVDLYQWMHLTAADRAQMLLNYARTITMDEIEYWQPELDDEPAGYAPPKDPGSPNSCGLPCDLQGRLAEVEVRLKDLEDGHAAGCHDLRPQEKNKKIFSGKASKGTNESVVICQKSFCGFADVFEPDSKGSNTGGWLRCRAVVKKGALGKILGKTHENLLMVCWTRDEKVGLYAETRSRGYKNDITQSRVEQLVEEITLSIDPQHCVQYGTSWEDIQLIVDSARGDQKASV